MVRSHESLDVRIFRDIKRENETTPCFLHVFDSTYKELQKIMVACGEAAEHIPKDNGKYENGRHCSPKLLVSEATISGRLQLRCSSRRFQAGCKRVGYTSQNIHGLQVPTLARTSLAKKLMKHANPLENCKNVHQISECLRPILGAVASRLSARSCVAVVCRPSITAQIVLRVTAGLAPWRQL